MLKNRIFTVVKVNPDNSQSFDLDAKGIEVKYRGEEVSVKL